MALASLDRLLAKKKNQKALMDALEKDLLKDPVYFFKTVVMPLLPREAKLSLDREGVIQWKSLIGASADPVGSVQLAVCSGESVGSGQEAVGSGESVVSGQVAEGSKAINVPSEVANASKGA